MKTKAEINYEIKALQQEMNKEFSKKRTTESGSLKMEQIDSYIDKLGAKIRALQWVISETDK